MPISHQYDQGTPVRQPAHARRRLLHLRLDAQITAVFEAGVDPVAVEVGEPDPVVPPPRSLQEMESRRDGGDLPTHGSSSPAVRSTHTACIGALGRRRHTTYR